ncbi:MAG TPA: carboxypeptidase-like regulatory domain-containing protein [Candidatus Angelobacter sp.]
MATFRILLVFLSFFAPGLAQQTAQDQFKLEGVVVNALTGRPVPRALVVLSGTRGMLTGAQGEFSFAGVSAGTVQINVTKPGFFAPGAKTSGWSMPMTVQVGPDTGPAVVKLTPEAVVFGRVTGKDEEPLEGVSVQVQTFSNMNGRQQLTPTPGNIRTDEDGNFRIAGLPPGRYYVSIKAGNVSRRILGARSQDKNEGYQALVYYPGTTDFGAAGALELSPGQHMETNFSLAPVPMFKVAGAVTIAGDWKQVQPPMIVDRSEQPLFNADQFDSASGAFEFKSVPAGTYSVRTAGMDQEGHYVTAHHTITVTEAVANLKLSLQPGVNIPVIVRTEFSRERPKGNCTFTGPDGALHQSDCSDYPAARVELLPVDGSPSRFFTDFGPVSNQGSYALRSVTPGKYKVRAMASFAGYVQAVRSGGVDLLREQLVVPEGAEVPPIEVVVRDDTAMLKIHVRKDKPAQLATIVLFPEAAELPEPRTLSTTVNADLQFGPLPPGSYRVFAFDSAEAADYSNPEVLEKYASQAATVTLTASGTASITVDLIHAGD